jgi:TonB family protein
LKTDASRCAARHALQPSQSKKSFMRTLLLTVAAFLLATSAGFGQSTQKQSPELVQSTQLNSEVLKLYNEGKYDEALPLAKRALELREKALGATHENLIPLLVNLGEIYRAKKKPGEARSYLERALQLSEKSFGPEDLRITRLLDKLGFITYQLRNENGAKDYFARSLAIKEKVLGPDHSEVAQTVFNLAEINRIKGDYQKAQPLFEQAIRIREKSSGKDNSELINVLQSYVVLLFAENKTDEGSQAQKRIVELLGEKGTVPGGVLNGKAVKLEQPPYPAMARQDHASGLVQVQVLIDETGRVIQAKTVNPGNLHPALVAAAENAARHSAFTPTLLSGHPVKVYGIIIYNFVAR